MTAPVSAASAVRRIQQTPGFGALRDAWRSRSSTNGTRVGLSDGGDGLVVDVDGEGALLVDVGGGTLTRVVATSSVSARGEDGLCCS